MQQDCEIFGPVALQESLADRCRLRDAIVVLLENVAELARVSRSSSTIKQIGQTSLVPPNRLVHDPVPVCPGFPAKRRAARVVADYQRTAMHRATPRSAGNQMDTDPTVPRHPIIEMMSVANFPWCRVDHRRI